MLICKSIYRMEEGKDFHSRPGYHLEVPMNDPLLSTHPRLQPQFYATAI